MFVLMLVIFSFYLVWGWITLNDIRQYCDDHNLDYEQFAMGCIPELPGFNFAQNRENGDSEFEILSRSNKSDGQHGPERYFVHFLRVSFGGEGSPEILAGSLLSPFLFMTENTANAVFCLGLGYIISLLIVGIRFNKGDDVSFSQVLCRPLLGSLGSMVFFLIVFSGGKLLWAETSGVSGVSLGVIALIASIHCEKSKFVDEILMRYN